MKAKVYLLDIGYIQENGEDYQENIIMYVDKQKALNDRTTHISKRENAYVEMWEQNEELSYEEIQNIIDNGVSEDVFIDMRNEVRIVR